MSDHDEYDDETQQRTEVVRTTLVKGAIFIIGTGLFVWLAAMLLVRALGLEDAAGEVGGVETTPDAPLPSTALAVPSQSATSEPSDPAPTPAAPKRGELALNAPPARVGAGQRIDLSGRYAGQDGVKLTVQRNDGSGWGAFADVGATVRGGSFQTWVQTSRVGQQQFRMLDPRNDKTSNAVTITIG